MATFPEELRGNTGTDVLEEVEAQIATNAEWTRNKGLLVMAHTWINLERAERRNAEAERSARAADAAAAAAKTAASATRTAAWATWAGAIATIAGVVLTMCSRNT